MPKFALKSLLLTNAWHSLVSIHILSEMGAPKSCKIIDVHSDTPAYEVNGENTNFNNDYNKYIKMDQKFDLFIFFSFLS